MIQQTKTFWQIYGAQVASGLSILAVTTMISAFLWGFKMNENMNRMKKNIEGNKDAINFIYEVQVVRNEIQEEMAKQLGFDVKPYKQKLPKQTLRGL